MCVVCVLLRGKAVCVLLGNAMCLLLQGQYYVYIALGDTCICYVRWLYCPRGKAVCVLL